MKKFLLKSLMAVLVLGLSTGAFADSLTLTGANGPGPGLGSGNGQQAGAISFTALTNQTNLSMTVGLSGFSFADTVTWWLTNSLGLGTTGANVLDSGTFTGPSGDFFNPGFAHDTVFSGKNLAAGTYYVVLSVVGANGNNTGWMIGDTLAGSGNINYGGSYVTSQGPNGFAPGFDGYFSPYNLQFDLESDQAVNTPEPASLALLGSGLLGMGSFVRRKFVS